MGSSKRTAPPSPLPVYPTETVEDEEETHRDLR